MANDGRNVSLTERYRRFIDAQVAAGRHASASEVVREALRRYESEMEAKQAAVHVLWALAEKSESGEAISDYIDIEDRVQLDRAMDEILEDVRRRVRARRTAR
jgi:antitoxin ParD1/3/4